MTLAVQTVNDFVQDSYQIITANSPTVPLQGNDLQKGVQFLNELIKSYSSSSLLLPIAQKIQITVQIGQLFVTFGDPSYVPTPDVTIGRLSNLERAWLSLDGVDYPLIDESRGVFFGSYKYFPQLGLPRFVIITNDLNLTTMQLYPGPSQQYDLWVYGKFEPSIVVAGGLMTNFPLYQIRFLKTALARELAYYKGRSAAWDEKLEKRYQELLDEMESVSTMDLVIDSANESYLNGSWRLRAGV
jgi:hypothetical protein